MVGMHILYKQIYMSLSHLVGTQLKGSITMQATNACISYLDGQKKKKELYYIISLCAFTPTIVLAAGYKIRN